MRAISGVKHPPKAHCAVVSDGYSQAEYLDCLDLLYCRYLERASPREIKANQSIWFKALDETKESLITKDYYNDLLSMVHRYRLKEVFLAGRELSSAVQEHFPGAVVKMPEYRQGELL